MTDEAMSPLRRRMIEDMMIRKFAPKIQLSCKIASTLTNLQVWPTSNVGSD